MARVGHGAERLGGVLDHLLDGLEHDLRADRAVAADHVHGPFVQLAREGLGIRAVGQVAVVVDGDLGDDGHLVAGGLARGEDGLAQLVEVGEGLEDQQVDAGLEQRLDLLAEDGARLGEGGGTERLDADAQRSDRAGHEGRLSGRLARQAHAGLVDGLQLLGEAEGGQARAVGAEGVGLEDLRAGLDVLLVDFLHQGGRGEVELVEAAVDEDALAVQHGPHGAVGHEDTAGQLFTKLLGSAGGHQTLRRPRWTSAIQADSTASAGTPTTRRDMVCRN